MLLKNSGNNCNIRRLDQLPDELLLMVLEKCGDYKTVVNAMCACKKFSGLVQTNWRRMPKFKLSDAIFFSHVGFIVSENFKSLGDPKCYQADRNCDEYMQTVLSSSQLTNSFFNIVFPFSIARLIP